MAGRSGLFAQLGVAAESAYGTYVAPTRFLEFVSESLNLTIARDEAKGIRSGQRVLRNDHWQSGAYDVSGDITFEVGNLDFGLLFKQAMGAVTTTTDGAGYKHSCAVGAQYGSSLSLQVGRPDVGDTVDPFSYLGCKVAGWEIDQKLNDFLQLKVTVDGQTMDTGQSLASASAPSETELYHWSGCDFTVAGSAFDATDFTLKADNGLNTDRRFLKGSVLKKEPIENKKRQYSGTITGEFESMTAYNRFLNGTTAAIVGTWTAVATYDTSKPYKLVITANCCRFDGTDPQVKDESVLEQPLPFEVLDDGTNPVLTIDYYTSQATP